MPATWIVDAPHPVREDIRQAHAAAWDRIAGPGTWLTGAQRVAVAAEARHARTADAIGIRLEDWKAADTVEMRAAIGVTAFPSGRG